MATSRPRSVEPGNLGRGLARRLLPASIIIGATVSIASPSAYYLVHKSGLERAGEVYARNLATRFHDKSPDLWARQTDRDFEMIRNLVAPGEIVTIQVRDLSGRPLGGFTYTGPRAGAWWNRKPPLGAAPVLFNNRAVGFLEVGLARDSVLRTALVIFGVSTAVGMTLAALIYWFPVTVGRAMDKEMRMLIGRAEAINAELTDLLARSRRQHEEAVELEQVARDITSSLDRVQVLHLIVERARTLCKADLAWLAAYDVESETARIVALAGAERSALTDLVARPGTGAAGWVLQHERPLCLDGADPTVVDADERRAFATERLVAIAMVPLRIRDVPAGILAVAAREPRRFDDEMTTVMRIASQAGVALENARLYEERTVAAQEAERRRIAYDLHDGIAQLIVSAKQHLDTCQAMWDTNRPRAANELAKGVDRLQRALTETRDILTSLRPSSVEGLGLTAAIQTLLIDTARQQGWSTEFRDRLGDRPLPFAVETAVFRITQEALSNAARHAAARHVSVELRHHDEGWIEATIGDDGRGFHVKPGGESTVGIGLESMRERARLLGGSVTVSSASSGTVICVRLSLSGRVTW
jgi:signal transduction histidine kinase